MTGIWAVPSDAVKIAILGSFATFGAQVFTYLMRRHDRKRDAIARAKLAQKVDEHSEKLNEKLESSAQKLETNTKITIAAATGAQKAFTEANNFNERLYKIEVELKERVEAELKRLSDSIQAIVAEMENFKDKIKNE